MAAGPFTMRIVVKNCSNLLKKETIEPVIAAVNTQISEHFAKYWYITGKLEFGGTLESSPNPQKSNGDTIIYLANQVDVDNALGYHYRNNAGCPYGFVGVDLDNDKTLDANWTVTFSHEVLELLLDTYVNLWAVGPHPTSNGQPALFWYEACDVQADTYDINGIEVSNFVLPHYFTPNQEQGFHNDYLTASGNPPAGPPLKSFGVRPGGYMGFMEVGRLSGVKQVFGTNSGKDAFLAKRASLHSDLRRTFVKTQSFNGAVFASRRAMSSRVSFITLNEAGEKIEEGEI